MMNKEQSRSHTCDACGGVGLADREPFVYEGAGLSFQEWHLAIAGLTACPVCLGAGRIIDDSTSQRDADADVDTLRLVAGCDSSAEFSYQSGGWFIAHFAIGNDEQTMDAANRAVRAAFRAVPGLRG